MALAIALVHDGHVPLDRVAVRIDVLGEALQHLSLAEVRRPHVRPVSTKGRTPRSHRIETLPA